MPNIYITDETKDLLEKAAAFESFDSHPFSWNSFFLSQCEIIANAEKEIEKKESYISPEVFFDVCKLKDEEIERLKTVIAQCKKYLESFWGDE